MPTPYGSRGGMAFGAEELRVLRRALALALHPDPASAEDVQNCLRLAGSVDEATREGARLRAFVLADLARYRAALPGTVTGYLALLEEALAVGYRPAQDDLAALRALRGNPTAAALLGRCSAPALPAPTMPAATIPASRARLRAIPGGRTAENTRKAKDRSVVRAFTQRPTESEDEMPTVMPAGTSTETATEMATGKPAEPPASTPTPKPEKTPDPGPAPTRPIPTPGEVFPPKRKPAAPPESAPRQLAAG